MKVETVEAFLRVKGEKWRGGAGRVRDWESISGVWCQQRKVEEEKKKISVEHVCRQTTMKIVSEKKFKAGSEEAYLKVDPAGMWEGGSEKQEKRLKGSGVRVQMDRDTQQTNRIQKSSFRCSIWLCACLLQASEYSEQVRLHETGCQSTQEESKSKILPMNYKNRGFCSLIVVPQLLYTATVLACLKIMVWCTVSHCDEMHFDSYCKIVSLFNNGSQIFQ